MIVLLIALPHSTIVVLVRLGFMKDLVLFTDGPAILAIGYCDYRFIPRIVSSRSQPLGKCRRGDNARDTEAIECEQISLISGDQPISPPCLTQAEQEIVAPLDRWQSLRHFAKRRHRDRTSVVKGKRVSVRVDPGGRRTINKKNN